VLWNHLKEGSEKFSSESDLNRIKGRSILRENQQLRNRASVVLDDRMGHSEWGAMLIKNRQSQIMEGLMASSSWNILF
jgi:hypothetical protein